MINIATQFLLGARDKAEDFFKFVSVLKKYVNIFTLENLSFEPFGNSDDPLATPCQTQLKV